MNRFFMLLFACFVLIEGRSQDSIAISPSGDKLTFTITENNPGRSERINAGVYLAGFDLAQIFAMGYGFDIKVNPVSFLQINANTFMPYFKYFDSEVNQYMKNGIYKESKALLKNYNKSELGLTVFVMQYVKDKNEGVIISKNEGKRHKQSYMLHTDIKTLYKIGARGGYYYYQQSAGNLLVFNDFTANGVTLHVRSIANHSMYIGLSQSIIQYFIMNNPDFGFNVLSKTSVLYCDLLYGISETHTLSPVLDLDAKMEMAKWGFRVGASGIKRHPKLKHAGLLLGIEFGARPIQYVSQNTASDALSVPYRFFISIRTGINFGLAPVSAKK